METKICNKCKIKKTIDNFRIYNKKGKQYIQTICKQCENKRNKEYIEKHKEEVKIYKKEYAKLNEDKIKKYKKKYYEENFEKIQLRGKRYYQENKETLLANNKIYRKNNRDEDLKRNKIYYQRNKERIIKNTSLYKKNRSKKDNIFKLGCQLRHLIGLSFSRKGFIKSKHTEEIIGMSLNEFYYYLLQTFENNYGYKWDGKEKVHIDHIKPLKYAITEEEVIKLCHYTNLQLLKAKDNLIKHDKLDWRLNGDK